MICENCGKEHDGSYTTGRFCSSKCARAFSTKNDNKKDTKEAKCTECGTKIQINKRASLKQNHYCEKCRPIKEKRKYEKRVSYINICVVCGNEFKGYKSRKTCSTICKNYRLSLKRQETIARLGTNNFHTKRELFSYKYCKNIECDSKLEQAGIIYLIDVFDADSIEKFNNILSFWEDEEHKRTFNPDFYVKKNDEVYIVEVKMKWCENSGHDYNRTIPLKKIALENYCKQKNFNMIWLDFDYDKEFKKIYIKFLKDDKN